MLTLALMLVALLLSLIRLINSNASDLVAWATLCLSAALLLPHLPLR